MKATRTRSISYHRNPRHEDYQKFWLQQRRAKVAVGGKFSKGFSLMDMVFQGTVSGPPLWDVFYLDARDAIMGAGFNKTVFANDLGCFGCLTPA